MTPPRSRSNPLRCYGAFINKKPDVRTIRETAPQARMAGELWNPKRKLSIRVVRLSWRKV